MDAKSPTRDRKFWGGVGVGLAGLVPAVAIGVVMGVGDFVSPISKQFFTAAAGLVPVLALGFLAQLAAGGGLAVKWLNEASRRDLFDMIGIDVGAAGSAAALRGLTGRQALVAREELRLARAEMTGKLLVLASVPGGLALGLFMQFVLTEAVALYCVAAGSTSSAVGLAVGAELASLFVYLCVATLALGVGRAFLESDFALDTIADTGDARGS